MKLLVLGGTRFLGRHLVDAALARGDDVTIFTRGVQPDPLGRRGHGISPATATRRIAPGLAALEAGDWDAAIDTSGYVPRVVRASAELLAPRVGRYLFVSSISVYADASRAGPRRNGAGRDARRSGVRGHRQALRRAQGARASDVVREAFGARALNVRPGLIVGPHDPTDRFGYWVARFVHPAACSGDRATAAVVPAAADRGRSSSSTRATSRRGCSTLLRQGPRRHVQRDAARRDSGRWARWSTRSSRARAARRRRAARGSTSDRCSSTRSTPWTGLPLWIPASVRRRRRASCISTARRRERAGLRTRPLARDDRRHRGVARAARQSRGALGRTC